MKLLASVMMVIAAFPREKSNPSFPVIIFHAVLKDEAPEYIRTFDKEGRGKEGEGKGIA